MQQQTSGASRRDFMRLTAAGAFCAAQAARAQTTGKEARVKPNLLFVFGDQWRGQATGYAGDLNAKTPELDRLAAESLTFTNAISSCPVCSPYRASLLTGQYPLSHGVFVNDVYLKPQAVSIAEVLKAEGYDTAYIGKWHVDGHGRSNYIPPERRQGFDFWKVLECTHDYNNSPYYADGPEKLHWDGYDAQAQTREAQRYIREHDNDKPFVLFLSWGPPHAPYHTAPERFRKQFSADAVQLRGNVPQDVAPRARKDLAGYYAHMAALDACLGDLRQTLDETGLADDTIFVFTSDHGDMLGSHGAWKKQRPYEESILVPLVLRYPARFGATGRRIDSLIATPDLMPTLLSLAGAPIPETSEGLDFAGHLDGGPNPGDDAALIMCPAPFGQWTRDRGGREYRGVRTKRYTYTRSLDGPWLLFDNEKDPYQLENRIDDPEYAAVRAELEAVLTRKLETRGDAFKPAQHYLDLWGYKTDASGTVPYTP